MILNESIEERQRRELVDIKVLNGMTMSGLHYAFLNIYEQVGDYYIKQWLHQIKHPYD